MSAPGNIDDSRGRKRRLDHERDRATPSLETNSTAAVVGRNRSPFPQFSVPEHSARRRAMDATINSGGASGGGDGGSSTGGTYGSDQDPYGVNDDAFDATDLPNDTMAAVLSLQKEFYGAVRSPPSGRGRNSAKNGSSEGDGSSSSSSSARLGSGGGERTGVVLQHQIYTVLENRTAVDLELTSMRKENILRTFRLGTGREDWGVLSTDHYLRVIRNLLGASQTADSAGPGRHEALLDSGGGGGGGVGVGGGGGGGGNSSGASGGTPTKRTERTSLERDVLERLVLSNARAYVSRVQVSSAMEEVLRVRDSHDLGEGAASVVAAAAAATAAAAAAASAPGRGGAGKNFSVAGNRGRRDRHPVKRNPANKAAGGPEEEGEEEEELNLWGLKRKREEVLSLTSKLVRAGFLLPRRDVGREEAYWFSMPQLGKVITSISRGRKAIVGALKRTRYKEMRRAVLESKNPAKATGLPISFHVRDLLGLGMIRELETPSGAFLRLAQ